VLDVAAEALVIYTQPYDKCDQPVKRRVTIGTSNGEIDATGSQNAAEGQGGAGDRRLAGGIGKAAAIGCARHGADVAINYHSDEPGAADAVREIEALGRRAIAVKGDVAEVATAQAFVDAAVAAFGRVDVFVNNAGICPFHAFLDMPPEVMERTMKVNLFGAYYMVQAAANQMVKQGDGGAIIAVSSISALVGGGMQTHYTPTKAGVHSLMQSTAIALGKYGIRCNSVLPGTILTAINKEDLADVKKREYMAGRIPLGRLGEPDDLAGPIVFLASDLAKYVTGAALLVDGGAFVNLQ
jgi:L-rhamnose 1-dehydrogenase